MYMCYMCCVILEVVLFTMLISSYVMYILLSAITDWEGKGISSYQIMDVRSRTLLLSQVLPSAQSG